MVETGAARQRMGLPPEPPKYITAHSLFTIGAPYFAWFLQAVIFCYKERLLKSECLGKMDEISRGTWVYLGLGSCGLTDRS